VFCLQRLSRVTGKKLHEAKLDYDREGRMDFPCGNGGHPNVDASEDHDSGLEQEDVKGHIFDTCVPSDEQIKCYNQSDITLWGDNSAMPKALV
jgi:hypothetical protein